jgi:hypothetical protein
MSHSKCSAVRAKASSSNSRADRGRTWPPEPETEMLVIGRRSGRATTRLGPDGVERTRPARARGPNRSRARRPRRRGARIRPAPARGLTRRKRNVSSSLGRLPALLTEALDHAKQATDELRELAHGILPAILTMVGCAREWPRSPPGCRCRSRSTCPWAGSLARSRRPHTSTSPRR